MPLILWGVVVEVFVLRAKFKTVSASLSVTLNQYHTISVIKTNLWSHIFSFIIMSIATAFSYCKVQESDQPTSLTNLPTSAFSYLLFASINGPAWSVSSWDIICLIKKAHKENTNDMKWVLDMFDIYCILWLMSLISSTAKITKRVQTKGQS